MDRALKTPVKTPEFAIKERPPVGHKKFLMSDKDKIDLTASIAALIASGMTSTAAIAKKTKYSQTTVAKYRDQAMDMLIQLTPQRESIRTLEQQRCYWMIEQLSNSLKFSSKSKQKLSDTVKLTDAILRWSTHLSHLSGLMAETNVHVDPTKLVIIRSGDSSVKPPKIVDAEEAQTVPGITVVRSNEDDTSSGDVSGEE